ncbi:cAMP-binding domain of CRP or a regulatory subunit of cAMP-dependent protein kinases [Pedobacter westerhofensis]|uniref:cAMP-binding domain of CRP or a regulatory subunit of cAMP-dependent protein kinases n=1 Tax=Pedobacter westerhofensis TaxID=425512 RepID=A0A521AG84_9SPHI|nr:Crp/Fnr family transcriptional regulator [Pedobacter westerhofensis]SMO33806.1 cAMP-binding domain of CRP or a regulatory subunit of cAMP-dependent protein kinases [Pedobacter westerhofensis]
MADPKSLEKIELFIRQFIQPDEEEWKAFTDILQEKKLRKKDMLLEAGQVCNFIGFLNSGVIREYAFEKGKESTLDFVTENQFVVDFQSFIRGVKSTQYLEALTDVELLIFKKNGLNALYDKYKIWERFGRLIIEQVFCDMEAKRKKIIATSLEEQYHNFASAYPQVVQHVPQYYIASYLGLSPEHLSRIRKKI